ncbi:unnamed protein product, partial [Owenia fusiformis]
GESKSKEIVTQKNSSPKQIEDVCATTAESKPKEIVALKNNPSLGMSLLAECVNTLSPDENKRKSFEDMLNRSTLYETEESLKYDKYMSKDEDKTLEEEIIPQLITTSHFGNQSCLKKFNKGQLKGVFKRNIMQTIGSMPWLRATQKRLKKGYWASPTQNPVHPNEGSNYEPLGVRTPGSTAFKSLMSSTNTVHGKTINDENIPVAEIKTALIHCPVRKETNTPQGRVINKGLKRRKSTQSRSHSRNRSRSRSTSGTYKKRRIYSRSASRSCSRRRSNSRESSRSYRRKRSRYHRRERSWSRGRKRWWSSDRERPRSFVYGRSRSRTRYSRSRSYSSTRSGSYGRRWSPSSPRYSSRGKSRSYSRSRSRSRKQSKLYQSRSRSYRRSYSRERLSHIKKSRRPSRYSSRSYSRERSLSSSRYRSRGRSSSNERQNRKGRYRSLSFVRSPYGSGRNVFRERSRSDDRPSRQKKRSRTLSNRYRSASSSSGRSGSRKRSRSRSISSRSTSCDRVEMTKKKWSCRKRSRSSNREESRLYRMKRSRSRSLSEETHKERGSTSSEDREIPFEQFIHLPRKLDAISQQRYGKWNILNVHNDEPDSSPDFTTRTIKPIERQLIQINVPVMNDENEKADLFNDVSLKDPPEPQRKNIGNITGKQIIDNDYYTYFENSSECENSVDICASVKHSDMVTKSSDVLDRAANSSDPSTTTSEVDAKSSEVRSIEVLISAPSRCMGEKAIRIYQSRSHWTCRG